jgi:hypothetical protein
MAEAVYDKSSKWLLLSVKFKDRALLELFRRSEAMIESPLIKAFFEKGQVTSRRQDIEEAILVRFGQITDDARARLQGLSEDKHLRELLRFAILRRTMEAFIARLNQMTTPTPAPTSSRRKREN